MKDLLILGAGTAGTMAANKLRPILPQTEWQITLVDEDKIHYYQPGFLFMPFGIYGESDVVKPKRGFMPAGVNIIEATIDKVEPDANLVRLADGQELTYDYLIIATGATPRPEETPGLLGEEWRRSIHDFYTFDGASALANKLRSWQGGTLAVNFIEMPFKCPVAPLEFAFLADYFFQQRGIRDQVELVFVTPLSGAFTKEKAAKRLGKLLEQKGIRLVTDFYVESVDQASKRLISYDEEEVPFDLLVTVPVNMGADFVARSGLGDELNFVRVDIHTMQSKQADNIFALGDAAALPTSKAGSVAHFAVDVFVENFQQLIAGKPMTHRFDGHANCFIETGFNKGILLDFNYETEPLPGTFPLPKVGPFKLLGESRINHWGKMAFRWIYWNSLLKGKLPLPADMSLAGKVL